MMAKSRRNLLFVFVVVCLFVIVIMSALIVDAKRNVVDEDIEINVDDFPLEVELYVNGLLLEGDLSGRVFSVGDKVSGTVTVTNMCGKNVRVVFKRDMPAAWLLDISDTVDGPRIETMPHPVEKILRPNDKLTQGFEYELTEPGTYVLYVHNTMRVNDVLISCALEDIIIEVK